MVNTAAGALLGWNIIEKDVYVIRKEKLMKEVKGLNKITQASSYLSIMKGSKVGNGLDLPSYRLSSSSKVI